MTDVDNLKPKTQIKKRKRSKPLISPPAKKKVARKMFELNRSKCSPESLFQNEAVEGEF